MTLVFVPTIGFRPGGTRILHERAETVADDTRLSVVAAAAAPDRTEVRVEWERKGDPATCAPGSRIVVPGAESFEGVSAVVVVGTDRLAATNISRLGYHASYDVIGARHALSFAPLPADADAAELQVSEGTSRWRVPFRLGPGMPVAGLAVEAERGGVVVRAIALTRRGAELVVGLEVEAARQIRQVGAPLPTPVALASDDDADVRARRQELRRVLGGDERPITLHIDGAAFDEVERLFTSDAQQIVAGRAFISRFAVAFETPITGAKTATIVVPFVDLNDFDDAVTVDLRDAPLEAALGEHRFRVVRTERQNEHVRAEVEVVLADAKPRFLHPARMQATPSDSFSWGGDPERGPFWLSTHVGDPPIVTFQGVVLRVDGPWRLDLPLVP